MNILHILTVIACHLSADVLSDYMKFMAGENSKKQIANVDVILKDDEECVDHLMVVENVPQQPEPMVDEATMIRRATRKRKREEGEVFHDSFMEWMDYNWRMGIYPELDDAPKPHNWKWEHPSPENHHLPEWDGRFDENYDTDAMENGGVYGFSSDSEADEYFDLEMLGVSIEKMEVDEVEPPKTPINPDVVWR